MEDKNGDFWSEENCEKRFFEGQMPLEVQKKEVMEFIDKLSTNRQIEAMQTIKALLLNDISWEWIYEAIYDPYAKWQEKGFNLIFNHNFKTRIDAKLYEKYYRSFPQEIATKKLKEDLFADIGYVRSAF